MAVEPIVGWSTRTEWVESALDGDPAIQWCEIMRGIVERGPNGVPAEEAVKAHRATCADCREVARYWDTGSREYLRVKEGETLTRVRFRPMTARERALVRDEVKRCGPEPDEGEAQADFAQRLDKFTRGSHELTCYLAATIALDFPEWTVPRIEWHGLRVLPGGFIDEFIKRYNMATLTLFGAWIWRVSVATDDQKKTSSSGATTTKPISATATPPSAALPNIPPSPDSSASDSAAPTSEPSPS